MIICLSKEYITKGRVEGDQDSGSASILTTKTLPISRFIEQVMSFCVEPRSSVCFLALVRFNRLIHVKENFPVDWLLIITMRHDSAKSDDGWVHFVVVPVSDCDLLLPSSGGCCIVKIKCFSLLVFVVARCRFRFAEGVSRFDLNSTILSKY